MDKKISLDDEGHEKRVKTAELVSRLAQSTIQFLDKMKPKGTSHEKDDSGKELDALDDTDQTDPPILTPVQRALSTSVIFGKILENTAELSLFPLRRVCKTWETEVSTLLLILNNKSLPSLRTEGVWKSSSNVVRIVFSRLDHTMCKKGVGSLRQLTKLMTQGKAAERRFPCSRFVIICPHLLVCPSLTRFFIKHGHLIKSLALQFTWDSASTNSTDTDTVVDLIPRPYSLSPTNEMLVESLRNLLFKWAVNIKHLSIAGILWPGDPQFRLLDNVLLNQSGTLQKLEILQLQSNYTTWETFPSPEQKRIVGDILSCSPHLEQVLDSSFSYREQLIATNKMKTIKFTTVCLGRSRPEEGFGNLTRLAFITKHCKKLEHIKIDYSFLWTSSGESVDYPKGWQSEVELLNRILENNQNTLKTITGSQLAFLPGLKIPPMTRVNHLNLHLNCRKDFERVGNLTKKQYFQMFPSNLDLQKTFPNVFKLTLLISQHYWLPDCQVYCPFDLPLLASYTPLTSAQTLVLECQGRRIHELMEPLSKLTPNLQFLQVKYSDPFKGALRHMTEAEAEAVNELPLIVRAIWKHFPLIKSLDLPTEGYHFSHPQPFLNPDSFSIRMDSCITGLDEETVRELKKGPEGGSVKVPQERNQPSILDMKNLKYLRMETQVCPMFSYISATHGFYLIKDLKVVVQSMAVEKRENVLDDPRGLMATTVQFKSDSFR